MPWYGYIVIKGLLRALCIKIKACMFIIGHRYMALVYIEFLR